MKRRNFFGGLAAALAGGGLLAWFNRSNLIKWMMIKEDGVAPLVTNAPLQSEMCVLTTATTEGPFYVKSPVRYDVREDRKGLDMELELQVVQYPECTPMAGALVEIWSCDADGNYPGYPEDIGHDFYAQAQLFEWGKVTGHLPPTEETTYLRGAQTTDAEGKVRFLSIMPLWYAGRIPHVHYKIFFENKETLTGQFFFDQEIQDRIFTTVPPYNEYGKSPYNYDNDVAIAGHDEVLGAVLASEWDGEGALKASAKVGVQMA
jgi:protocatechuate 3,4-dioxygenase beta subunit